MSSSNSDVKAKDAFKCKLKPFGEIIETQDIVADVAAKIGDELFYFEIKKTKQDAEKGTIFGAATVTEWQSAIDNKEHYYFVLAIEQKTEQEDKCDFEFYIISPQKFMKYSYVPPFKIDFHIPYKKNAQGEYIFDEPGRCAKTYVISKDKSISFLQKAWKLLSPLALKNRKQKKETTNDFVHITDFNQLKESLLGIESTDKQ